MNKLPKEKRDKIILVCIFTIAASAAIWFLLISAQRKTLNSVREQAQKSKEQLARGNNTLTTRAQVNEQFQELSKRLKDREAAMAAPTDMYSWVVQTLNNFRLPYKVEIPQFGRELPSEVGIFPKFPYRAAMFNLQGTAHYHDFGKFLADFENAFPYIRVQNIDLSPGGETVSAVGDSSANKEKLNFKMELLTLVRPIAP
jgi:Tfp pilus assembly protein PilO